jgi:thiol-disulfide isomerase/thioredoxin
VVSVNGIEDAIPANSHLVYEFTSSANHYPRKMVLEDFVGTWCGWSPRGYVATEKMHEKYPNNFIPIEIHENSCYGAADAVGEPYNYGKYITEYSSTPTFLINRLKTIDSTLDEAAKAYEEQKDHADAIIQSNVVFVPEDNTSVTVKTSTTFGFTDDGNADFRIAYVVVEDNVGPYNQGNFYSDASMPDNPDDYLNEWYKKGSPVEMLFNDVARGIYPGLNGLEGSVPTSVVAGQPYEYEYTLELPDNIQDKKNIRIVTLLIDNKSGEIMNADQTKVIIETDMDGDANNDNVVDNKDVDAVVRYIMYGDIKGFNFKNADVNGDKKVNATDIVILVRMIREM